MEFSGVRVTPQRMLLMHQTTDAAVTGHYLIALRLVSEAEVAHNVM